MEIPNEAMSQPARDFILQCLHKDADRRPSIPQLLRHPWLKVFITTACLYSFDGTHSDGCCLTGRHNSAVEGSEFWNLGVYRLIRVGRKAQELRPWHLQSSRILSYWPGKRVLVQGESVHSALHA